MNNMMKLCGLIVIVIAASSYASYTCETPEKAITAYLKYDLDGQRLGRKVSADIDKLTENQHEPAWDVMTLIKGYTIQSIKQTRDSAVIKVMFQRSWETARKFNPEKIKDEVIEINMQEIEGCWKVGPPFYQPHVSSEVALKHLENLLENEKKHGSGKDYMDYTNCVLNSARRYVDAIKK